MKKVLLFLLVVCLVATGCGVVVSKDEKDKKEEKIEEPILGGWNSIATEKQVGMTEEEIEVFNNAIKEYTDLKVEPVAILAKQVVAGTNYMFLALEYTNGEEFDPDYKIVILFYDLEGFAKITKIVPFNYIDYTSINIDDESPVLSGGWQTEAPGKLNMISDEHVQEVFEKVTEPLDVRYNPIDEIAYQVVSGTNYAVLAYGKTVDAKEGIYLITMYEDLDGNAKLLSSAYIDLKAFN